MRELSSCSRLSYVTRPNGVVTACCAYTETLVGHCNAIGTDITVYTITVDKLNSDGYLPIDF